MRGFVELALPHPRYLAGRATIKTRDGKGLEVKEMRILYVGCGHAPDHVTAHPVAYTHELARLLLARGHKTAVFAPSSIQSTGGQPWSVFRRTHEGVDIYGVSNCTSADGLDPVSALTDPDCERAFRHAIQHMNPDVVHFQSLKGFSPSLIQVAQAMDRTVVVSMHDYEYLCPNRHMLDSSNEACSGPEDGRKCAGCIHGNCADRNLEEAYADRIRTLLGWVNDADVVMTPSAIAADIFADQGIDQRKLRIVPAASNVAERLWEKRTDNIRSDGVMTFGFIGTVARRNAPHLLVDATKVLRDLSDKFRVSIRGRIEDEAYKREIESKIRSLGSRAPEIDFAGEYRSDLLDEHFAGLDVYVSPQVWNNPSSRSTLDALGASTPVIASIVGNIAEIIGHGYNGLLFEPGNYIDLAAQMRQLIQNPMMTAAMRMNVNSPRPMSWHAEKVMDVYEAAAAARADEYAVAERKVA